MERCKGLGCKLVTENGAFESAAACRSELVCLCCGLLYCMGACVALWRSLIRLHGQQNAPEFNFGVYFVQESFTSLSSLEAVGFYPGCMPFCL